MLAAICRRLGFTFVLARRVVWAAIWEYDSGFINWVLVNLQQWFGFLSHTGLSPVPSASGGQHTLVSFYWTDCYIFPPFAFIGVPQALCSSLLSTGHPVQLRAK